MRSVNKEQRDGHRTDFCKISYLGRFIKFVTFWFWWKPDKNTTFHCNTQARWYLTQIGRHNCHTLCSLWGTNRDRRTRSRYKRYHSRMFDFNLSFYEISTRSTKSRLSRGVDYNRLHLLLRRTRIKLAPRVVWKRGKRHFKHSHRQWQSWKWSRIYHLWTITECRYPLYYAIRTFSNLLFYNIKQWKKYRKWKL